MFSLRTHGPPFPSQGHSRYKMTQKREAHLWLTTPKHQAKKAPKKEAYIQRLRSGICSEAETSVLISGPDFTPPLMLGAS